MPGGPADTLFPGRGLVHLYDSRRRPRDNDGLAIATESCLVAAILSGIASLMTSIASASPGLSALGASRAYIFPSWGFFTRPIAAAADRLRAAALCASSRPFSQASGIVT